MELKTIIKKDQQSECIINVFYIDDNSFIDKWIIEYIEKDIEEIKKKDPIDSNIISYDIESKENTYILYKKEKIIKKGYLYNTTHTEYYKLYEIKIMTFNDIDDIEQKEDQEDKNKTSGDMNKMILKELDKDELYQFCLNFENFLQVKEHWTKTELISLHSQILKDNNKYAYKCVSKRIRKSKNKSITNKTHINDILNDRSKLFNSCKTEYTVILK